MTQAAMAEGIGVSQGNISNYERGQTMPPSVAMRLIEYASSIGLSITFDDVYGLKQKVKKPRRPRQAPTVPS